MPKDEGQGLIISAFVSREYGFNWELFQSQLDQLNKTCENQIYVDEQAAISKKGTAKKEPIQSSPFKRQLEYGANKEGYWSHDDMILQLEDCIDCLTFLRAAQGEQH